MRAVLDVGQFVSATIQPRGHPAEIFNAWRDNKFELVTSLPILEDLHRVLGYAHIRKRHDWTNKQIETFINSIALAATLTPGLYKASIVEKDPTDDKVVACAIEAQADYIVASDKHLTDLKEFAGIQIVPPKQFLKILSDE